ncbi:LytR/AlgR family response regulator transcription factor [Pedobacter boryungensis]|uniref:Response regulator transcription factor n=1 Tax=Pedobacter boryungensis TaxID=869962 RepID=A0ABX2DAX6_9SPHI|nr:LytTR family DNA-binding domain-containing protein [Pedobacter boryungensis]NQX31216.1 response regulator transcription factor [Pedobacter boryungensis]
MNYSCLIVDDNEIERDAIEMYLRKVNQLDIKAVCSNGVEAAEVLANEPIDIVFSDIDMPELSGMGLLKSIKSPPVFIFITSFTEYAAESFNLDALDFIVKPATFERLLKASTKAIEYLDLKKKVSLNSNPPPAEDTDDHFFIKETKGFTRLNYNDVIYIESMGDFSKIYTANDKHVTLVNLKSLERQLPAFFIRVHKQYIINLNQIATITQNEIVLNHNNTVPVSLINRQELVEKIANKTISRHKP